jgi:RNA polymerase sigma-70 factor (ECF subfamily)
MKSFFEAHIWPQKGKLYRIVYLWVKDRSLAEDLLQSVFEKAFRREVELQSHPNLSGWLVKSLKNEVLIHFRQNKNIDSLEGIEQIEMENSGAEEITESVSKVMLLLKNLPLGQREVFQLREVEGLSYDEIAAHLEISMEQVKVNLHRARLGIRKSMISQKLNT